MSNRSSFNQVKALSLSPRGVALSVLAFALLCSPFLPKATGADTPTWMRSLVNAPLPEHDDKTDAVLLYAEDILTVQGNGKIKRLTRRVYKILRLGGKEFGVASAEFDAETKINNMHGWCIPSQGKDYEVKEKDALESALPGVANGELISDLRVKLLRIPAADPGNIVGYEIEQEVRPYVFQQNWMFQSGVPTREARFTLQLPQGWEYKATWMNFAEVKPASIGSNQWQWMVSDVKAIRHEVDMPPWRGIAGQMLVSFLPPGGSDKKGFENWSEMGKWESNLVQGRRDPSPEIKQKVTELTAGAPPMLAKMQALAAFVQREIRYVAIELGIGGWQPHAARDIFSHRFGDCKDKATLLSAMLKEIGVDSYYISINVTRGAVTPQAPPQMYWFDHEILGIRLPVDLQDPSLVAVYSHPTLGRILIFDPTDEMTPFGQLRGALQANYGLLVHDDSGELIKLPQLLSDANGIQRFAKFSLDAKGTLTGEVVETRLGDTAAYQRYELRSTTKESERIQPIETTLSHSLANFQITKASVGNWQLHDKPFLSYYSFISERYAKPAGELLLLRPRVIGIKSSDILEKKEPRKYPVEFEGPVKNMDTYEIKLPEGYTVDELPPAANAEYSFGSFHSLCQVKDGTLSYSRTLEIKELSVPVDKLDQLKTFYRIIATDERSTAVLKPVSK